MRDFRLLNDSLFLAQWNQEPIHHSLSSCVSLLFDFLPQTQAIVASFFPPLENIRGIWVKTAVPFSPPLGFGKGLLFEPAPDGSYADANALRDLCRSKAVSV